MMKIRKIASMLLILAILITPSFILASNNQDLNFDEYGFKSKKGISSAMNLYESKDVKWEVLTKKSNVPLKKMWTIEFSRIFSPQDIDAVVIEHNNQYIPVTISKTSSNKLAVSPRDEFAGNTEYVLKVLLNNGNRYKMDFRTVNSNRDADVEPNNNYLNASSLYLNETIDGEITQGDVDFFKVEVPAHGTLNLNLTGYNGKGMEIYLYGPEGNNNSATASKRNFTQGGISGGLMPGTYYIRVNTYYSQDESSYTLEVNFVESTFQDDSGTSNYLNAKMIKLNTAIEGHIGYYSDYGVVNYNDFFKVEVPTHGTLNLNLTGYNGKGMEIYLYGPEGNNNSATASKRNFTQGGISGGVMPGTYYIRVSTYYSTDYSPYKLEVDFVESTFQDDSGTSNYLDAKTIKLNTAIEGHIGYYSDYGVANYNDYFKVEVPTDGILSLDLTGYNGRGMEIYLYGSEGTNKGAIGAKRNFTEGGISADLTPGTYYVRVSTYYSTDYSPYRLNLKFK